jgi:hypothetical protein
MITKKEELQILIREGKTEKALKLASGFRRDFNEDEQRDIQIAAECIGNTSRAKFYTQLGWNLDEIRKEAEKHLTKWYSSSLGSKDS